MDEQIGTLRTICVHSGFIAFASPHIRGAVDDETEFVKRLIQSALDRPEGFSVPVLHIHTEGPNNYGSSGFERAIENLVANVEDSFGSSARGRARIRLFVWRKLLERVLLAGDHAPERGEASSHGLRWGVSFTHVGRPNDKPKAYRATWALMDKGNKEFWRNKLYPEATTELLHEREF